MINQGGKQTLLRSHQVLCVFAVPEGVLVASLISCQIEIMSVVLAAVHDVPAYVWKSRSKSRSKDKHCHDNHNAKDGNKNLNEACAAFAPGKTAQGYNTG